MSNTKTASVQLREELRRVQPPMEKHLVVTPEVHERVQGLKYKLRVRTVSEAIKKALDAAERELQGLEQQQREMAQKG